MYKRRNKVCDVLVFSILVVMIIVIASNSIYVFAEGTTVDEEYAYSIGTDYSSLFHSDIDTSGDAEYAATGIIQGASGTSSSSGYTYVGVDDLDLSDTKLYVLAACQTASSTYGITRDIVREAGAEAAIGWAKSVEASSHTEWLKRFCDKLAQGYSVGDARMYADSFTYADSDVKSALIYGDVSLTICSVNARSLMGTDDKRNILDNMIKLPVALYEDELKNELIKILESLGQDVTSREFLIKCNDSAIDLICVRDGVETMEGYTFIINNSNITHIYNNIIDESYVTLSFATSTVRTSLIQNVVTKGEEEQFLEKARNEISDEYIILEQSGKILYDSSVGKYFYHVLTDYQLQDEGLLGRSENYYEIN